MSSVTSPRSGLTVQQIKNQISALRGPENHLVHLAQKNSFADLFVQGVQAERDSIHDCYLALPLGQAEVAVTSGFCRVSFGEKITQWLRAKGPVFTAHYHTLHCSVLWYTLS